MKKTTNPVMYERQKKFLLVLPVLAIPFITLAFWALGGGKKNNASANQGLRTGINLKLPDAKLKDDKGLDKLSFYHQAALDSVKTKAAEKLDPYWKRLSAGSDSSLKDFEGYGLNNNKEKVYEKLSELNKALDKSRQPYNYDQKRHEGYNPKSYDASNEVAKLRAMMEHVNSDNTPDPEIEQLNEMLDKIKSIQDPQGNTGGITKTPIEKKLEVKMKNSKAGISLIAPGRSVVVDTNIVDHQDNAFYSVSSFDNGNASTGDNAIAALIPETQTIVTGSTIKLAISDDVTIQNVVIPSGTYIYGTASLSNERLIIKISSIRFQNSILPVALSVFDMDGQEGLFIPGSINRTVAKESANKAVSSVDATIIDPSIGAQAASAGIEAAKTIFGKKVKLIKLTIKSGYKVLLKDEHEQ